MFEVLLMIVGIACLGFAIQQVWMLGETGTHEHPYRVLIALVLVVIAGIALGHVATVLW